MNSFGIMAAMTLLGPPTRPDTASLAQPHSWVMPISLTVDDAPTAPSPSVGRDGDRSVGERPSRPFRLNDGGSRRLSGRSGRAVQGCLEARFGRCYRHDEQSGRRPDTGHRTSRAHGGNAVRPRGGRGLGRPRTHGSSRYRQRRIARRQVWRRLPDHAGGSWALPCFGTNHRPADRTAC